MTNGSGQQYGSGQGNPVSSQRPHRHAKLPKAPDEWAGGESNAPGPAVPAANGEDRITEPPSTVPVAPKHRRRWWGRRDWGRIAAKALCVCFALVGLVPLSVGLLVRLEAVRSWAAERTTAVLRDQYGVHARYELQMQLWPLEIALHDVVVDATDGGDAFLKANRVVARPRMFSLLAGKLDVGEIQVEEPRLRAVIQDGKLKNFNVQQPATEPAVQEEKTAQHIPFSVLALTNARLDVMIDDTKLNATEVDVDVVVDGGPLEVSLRAGRSTVQRLHVTPGRPAEDMVDDDVLCRLDLRARIEPKQVLVRRLELQGAVDFDPDPDTTPSCRLGEEDWRRFGLQLEAMRVKLTDHIPTALTGRLRTRLPVALAHRFVDFAPLTGWVMADLTAHWDGSTKLPKLNGKFGGSDLSIDRKVVSRTFVGEIDTTDDRIEISNLLTRWASSKSTIRTVHIDPFKPEIPLIAKGITVRDLQFDDMLDELASHPRAHVSWTYETASLDVFGGTINPLQLAGRIQLQTKNFNLFDQPAKHPARRRMIGVDRANINGIFKVTPNAVVLHDFHVKGPHSQLRTHVSLGFDEILRVAVFGGSVIDLQDISPLIDIPLAGMLKVQLNIDGPFEVPAIEGELSISDFVFAGFDFGQLDPGRFRFIPLQFELRDSRLRSGDSIVGIPYLGLDFDAGATVLLRADVDTRSPKRLLLSDFFEIAKLNTNPSLGGLRGQTHGLARVEYILGGPQDRCRTGRIRARGQLGLNAINFWGEDFESGSLDADFIWDDIAAGTRGMRVDLYAATFRKGPGTIVAQASIRHGGKLQLDATGAAIPLERLAAYRAIFDTDDPLKAAAQKGRAYPEATVSFVAAAAGTLERIKAQADLDISPLRIGPAILPTSQLHLELDPNSERRPGGTPPRATGPTSFCGNPLSSQQAPTRRNEDDPVQGILSLRGKLFGKQVTFTDLQITQQRSPQLSGTVHLKGFDLGAAANLLKDVAFSSSPPEGHLTAKAEIDELPLTDPGLAEVRIYLESLVVGRYGHSLSSGRMADPILISGDVLRIPNLNLHAKIEPDFFADLVAGGRIANLSGTPELDLSIRLKPIDLAALAEDVDQLDSAAGVVRANLELSGTTSQPTLAGNLTLKKGALEVKGFPLPLDEIDVLVNIEPGEIVVKHAKAKAGDDGSVKLNARLPIKGLELTGATAELQAKRLRLPVAEGINMTVNASLAATYQPNEESEHGALPNVTGKVSLTSFSYTRPMSFSLDIEQLTGGGPTSVESYNPAEDVVRFDVNLTTARPLKLANNILDMQVDVSQPGLRLVGTDQRFGARGTLQIVSGSKVFLLGHHFTVRDGMVMFEDTTRIAPRLDIHASTEYRRYASSAQTDPNAASSGSSSTSSTSTASASSIAGKWRIAMHASGDTDNPKVRFTSDPPLSQEDILLLLQLGMTRAELDRGLAGSLAQSVGLSALSSMTGLDRAVRSSTLIDEFTIGSQYSSRTGRTEPTATIGKRLTDEIRASVTTGLTENSEVRSNIEWKLGKGLSLEGSYDNVNDVGTSGLGNLGADLRWRLEFE